MAAPAATEATERGRRQVVALLTVFYLLLILEGALRKWVFPSLGQLLFFIRDPCVLAMYWLALRHGFFPRGSFFLKAGVALGLLGLLMIGVQAMGVAATIAKWPILALYGWRNYFLYIPLPFVIAATVRQEDLQRLAKITFLLAIPVAMLVLLQFRSPLEAPINVGFAANAVQQFRGLAVDMNHTRPMGTFTSDVGQKEFIVTALALLMAVWIAPATRRYLKPWQTVVVTCAVLTCLAVSGSRGAMIASALVLVAAVGSAAVVRAGVSARAVLVPALLAALAVVLYPLLFPEGYSTFMNRWTEAQSAEKQMFATGVLGRAFYSFYDFVDFLGDTPIAGFGLGLAGNASLTLGVVIPGFTRWAESDWARHIVDLGPLVGMVFIFYRVALVIWVAQTCIRGARASAQPLPLLLFASCALDLLYGEITGHGTVNGYAWLFTGLTLAAASVQSPVLQAGAQRSPAATPAPFPNLMR